MIRRPPRSTLDRSSAASDVYKRQYLQSSGTKTKTAPTVTMKGPDATLYALVGSWSISSRFNGVYYSGKYTYDETLTAPDGSVWGTWKGTQLLDMWGRPYGPKYGTCNNPL